MNEQTKEAFIKLQDHIQQVSPLTLPTIQNEQTKEAFIKLQDHIQQVLIQVQSGQFGPPTIETLELCGELHGVIGTIEKATNS